MNKIFAIAENSFKDAIRQKILLLFAFVAVLLTALSFYMSNIDLGEGKMRFIADFADGAAGFFGAIIAILVICQSLYSEFDTKSVYMIISKPVSYAQFVFGKFIGAAFLIGVYLFIISLVSCAELLYAQQSLKDIPAELLSGGKLQLNVCGLFAYFFAQWAKLCAVCAMAGLLAVLSKSLMFSMVMSFCAYAVCLLKGSVVLADNIVLKTALAAFPDLSVFDISRNFLFGEINFGAMLFMLGYSAIYIVVFGAISAYALSQREF